MTSAPLIRRLGTTRWFATIGRHTAPLDRWLFQHTRGRLGLFGPAGAVYPTLLLTTTGRRTGNTRTTPLMFVREGDRIVISSENFGQERPAAWPLNLEADPEVLVQIAGDTLTCRARPARDDEIQQFWPRLVEMWPAHDHYLRRSGVRRMFVLEPR